MPLLSETGKIINVSSLLGRLSDFGPKIVDLFSNPKLDAN
jgi:hypothetical protein